MGGNVEFAPYRVKLDNPKLNILLYGKQGIGKSTLAASAQEHPAMSPVLFANFEGGLLSLTSRGDVDAIDIKSMDQMDKLFWLLQNQTPPFNQYKTIVIDSGSEMQNLAMEEATRAEIASWQKKNQGKVPERTIDDIEIQTYGKVTAQLSRLFRWYRDLPLNVIITALPKMTYIKGADQRTATPTLVEPFFTNKLGTQLMGYMDMVWYLGEDPATSRKFILPKDRGPYRAKTRGFNFLKALGEVYADPWLPIMYELLLSSEQSPDHATQAPPSNVPIQVADIMAEVEAAEAEVSETEVAAE